MGVEIEVNANSAPNWVGVGAGAELGNLKARSKKIDIKSLILGNILTNFVQRYAEISAKLRKKNIWGWFHIVLNFYKKKADIVKS